LYWRLSALVVCIVIETLAIAYVYEEINDQSTQLVLLSRTAEDLSADIGRVRTLSGQVGAGQLETSGMANDPEFVAYLRNREMQEAISRCDLSLLTSPPAIDLDRLRKLMHTKTYFVLDPELQEKGSRMQALAVRFTDSRTASEYKLVNPDYQPKLERSPVIDGNQLFGRDKIDTNAWWIERDVVFGECLRQSNVVFP
jgi:hypothetical protein